MSDSSSPHSEAPAPSSSETERSPLHRWGRRAAWAVGLLVGSVLLLVGGVLLVLQTETGATAAAQWLASAANPMPNTEITIERASGNWVRSLRLTNVTLTRTDTLTGTSDRMVQVDTLAARYRLLPLLQGRLHILDLSAVSPRVFMRQETDSTWNWGRALPAAPAEPDTTAAMPIRIDRLLVADGTFTASFYAEGRDSTARVRDLRLLAHDIQTASPVTGQLDTLGLRGQLPNDTTDLRLASRGALTDSVFVLDMLQLDSPRSHVRGHGRVPLLEGPKESVDDAALQLRATPFALRDLTLLVPTLDVDPSETVRLDLQVRGTNRRLIATADAAFSGGGTVTAHAEATPTTTTTTEGPPLHYRLDAQIRDLTSSLLGPPVPARNRINATVTVDLSGPSVQRLDGTADAQLTNTHWTYLRTPSLTFTSTFRNGEATVDLDGTINDTQLFVEGHARPLVEAPDATLTARIRDFNAASFFPEVEIESALSATTQIEARNLGADTQALDVALSLAPSRIGVQHIEKGTVSFDLQPDRTQFEGALFFPTGRVRTAGFATFDGTERFALTPLRLDQVNVAALMGDTTASRVTGTAQIEGRGFSPETMHLDASLTLHDSFYGPHHLASLTSQGTLADGRFTSTTDATLNSGEWHLRLSGRPFRPAPIFELDQGRFRHVDIGPFLQDTSQSSRLRGTMQGTMQGTDPATMTVDAGVSLDSSRINRQRIADASLDLQLRNGRLDTDLSLDTPKGGLQFAAIARPFAAVPTYQITEGTFDDMNVGAIAALSGLTTRLSGTMTLEGRGATASSLLLDAGLSFTNSRINEATLSEGRLTVSAERSRATADGQFFFDEGQLQLHGRVDSLDVIPTYAFQTTVDSLNVGALAGLDTLSARINTLKWTLDGRGTDLSTLTTSTTLSAEGVRVDQFTLDTVAMNGRLRRGRLVLDTLIARSNAFVSRGAGTLAVLDTSASSNFFLRTEIQKVKPLRSLVGAETLQLQEGVLETRIYGSSLTTQRFDGEAKLTGLVYNQVQLTEGEINFNGQRGRKQLLQRLEVNGTLGYLSVPSLSADRTRFDAVYDGSSTEVSTNVRLDATHSASLRAEVTTGAEQTEVTLRQFNLRFEDDHWSLLQDATITVNDQYRIHSFLLHSGSQQIAVDGIVDFDGSQNLVATAEGVQMGSFSSLVGLSGLGGTLAGALEFTGPATSPQLDSRLALDVRTENRDVGTLRLNANYEDLALSLDAILTHADGSELTAEGTLPVDLRLQAPTPVDVASRPVRFSLQTERFPVNWVDPFLDPETVRDVQGTLQADVEVRGTLATPELAGTASLADGGATLPTLQTRYRNARATLSFSQDELTLREAVLHSSNGGRLHAEGVINFPQLTVGQFDLTLDASNFLAIDTRAYRQAIIDGDMTLKGTTQRPMLSGNVQIQSAEVYYSEAFAESQAAVTEVALNQEDLLTLENRFGLRLSEADTTTFDTYEALAMDLTVHIQRNTWLRSRSTPEMNIQLMGDLELSKAHYEDVQVFGTINVVTERSTLRQFGQEFQITEGTVTFNGDPFAPYLTLEAVYNQQGRMAQETEVSITLRLEGRPDDLSATLTSEPPMDTRNILSYLATGQPADKLLTGGNREGGNFAAQLLLGQASNFVENLAASEFGLDVVRVQLRPSGVSYLTAGRYITPRFFVSIEQPVTTSNVGDPQTIQYVPDVTLEYQLLDTLMLRALSSQQSFRVNLLFEYAY